MSATSEEHVIQIQSSASNAGTRMLPTGARAQPWEVRSRLIALAFGIVLCVCVAELVLRVGEGGIMMIGGRFGIRALSDQLLPLGYDTRAIDALAGGQAYVLFDRELGGVATPGVDWLHDGVRYQNNADGLRGDRTYSAMPAVGTRRISAYGDSFTYCEQVEFQDCWTRGLEQELPNTEVLNFGVPGFGPDQAWLRYQRSGEAWHSCVVLIGHMVENVNRVVNRFRPFIWYGAGPPGAKPRFLLEGDQLVLLPNPVGQPDQLKDPVWVETNLGPHDAWYFPGEFVRNPM